MLFLELTKTSKDVKIKSFFEPINTVIHVTDKAINTINSNDITIDLVGKKAFGLSCIPKKWTLPHIVISDTFMSEEVELSEAFITHIYNALNIINITGNDDIIIRSSSSTEGLNERGELYSISGKLTDLIFLLKKSFKFMHTDNTIKNYKIPLIIQKYVVAHSAKGHLSNERRLSEHTRDWKCEQEDIKTHTTKYFPIALRNWRQEIDVTKYTNHELSCNVFNNIKEILKIPSSWVTLKGLRIHFEWVWDGKNIYLVQADQEPNKEGVDPKNINAYNTLKDFQPLTLIEIDKVNAEKYSKIKNVLIYKKLGLPVAPLYILKDIDILTELSKGNIPETLKIDIEQLIETPLIIRMDIQKDSKIEGQSLQREELHNLEDALTWLKEKAINYRTKAKEGKIIFIFHNFIPAISAAFAYAAPNERKVQIEALWGLPEGLYFNSHDKYIVDTKSKSINDIDINKFEIDEEKAYKHFFITQKEDGTWGPKILKAPFDWKSSIENIDWIEQIALDSRRIATEENKSLSIMWFVDIPKEVCESKIFPWHHEEFDPQITSRSKTQRKKSSSDKSFIISTNKDLDELRNEATKETSFIKRIRIQPTEDSLLRNKKILKEIGDLSKKIEAIILLEGGVLSHAYYQLMETGATVEVSHSFDNFEDKEQFNKLVRDKIPENIEKGGEIVNTAKLTKTSIFRALKDKLIEEAFEVFDADDDSLLGELADVSEVIDGMLYHLNIDKEELLNKQKKKYEKVGGFKDGLVLLDTENPIPTIKDKTDKPLFQDDIIKKQSSEISYKDLPIKKIDTSKDTRELIDENDNIIRVTIPMTKNYWSTSVMDLELYKEHTSKLKLSGKRIKSSYKIKLSIITKKENKQLVIEFD